MRKSKEYLYNINEIVNGLKIINKKRIKRNERTFKAYDVQSTTYPNAPVYTIREGHLKAGRSDAYVKGQRIFEGNSLYSIESIRKHLVNIEDSKKISKQSHKKENFKCSNCNHIKKMSVSQIVNNGFACPNCSKGTSYPELFFLAVNQHFGLDYDYQVTYKNGRFDFINHNTKIVVEMNGMSHYKDNGLMNHEITKVSDDKKRKWCEQNGYTLIFIDARKSEFEFIKNNINKCDLLPDIKEDDEKCVLEYIEKNKRYDVKTVKSMYLNDNMSINKIAKELNLTNAIVNGIINRNNIKKHSIGEHKRKSVVCVETCKVYTSITEASKEVNVSVTCISNALRGTRKSAGKHPETGEKLTWEYVD